jgi:A/G-specific adenine glycosylase
MDGFCQIHRAATAPAGPACEDRWLMPTDHAAAIARWYAAHARDLPWRRPGATAWSILVSEVMLQQTPVTRVLPAHAAWLRRWPEPAALAAATTADAVRQWDRLGYPRRAVRLHASSGLITTRHGGRVPASAELLRTLPGVGSYTAAAVASFAYGQRHAVLDTNVRRVLARLVTGTFFPAPAPTAAERRLAQSLLPEDGLLAARWSVGLMELGALVCTAARPRCGECPVAADCAWLRLGRPASPPRRSAPAYVGSDRQCRGRLLATLRASAAPVPPDVLASAWQDVAQYSRSLQTLIADGLVVRTVDGSLALPGDWTINAPAASRAGLR